mgnify:CR=1 FL=1
MITVRCKKCNTTLTSNHNHDYKVCGCENQTYVQGDIMGGNDLNDVVQVKNPVTKEPELKLGTEAPKKRTTRMIDIDIR